MDYCNTLSLTVTSDNTSWAAGHVDTATTVSCTAADQQTTDTRHWSRSSTIHSLTDQPAMLRHHNNHTIWPPPKPKYIARQPQELAEIINSSTSTLCKISLNLHVCFMNNKIRLFTGCFNSVEFLEVSSKTSMSDKKPWTFTARLHVKVL